MIAVLCIDDNLGTMFNSRRQSRDRVVTEKILELSDGKTLWMSSYSFKLFEMSDSINIMAEDDFPKKAEDGEYCFFEGQPLTPYDSKTEKIVLFKWNRSYPADVFFDASVLNKRRLVHTEDFQGSSHEKITMEVYE